MPKHAQARCQVDAAPDHFEHPPTRQPPAQPKPSGRPPREPRQREVFPIRPPHVRRTPPLRNPSVAQMDVSRVAGGVRAQVPRRPGTPVRGGRPAAHLRHARTCSSGKVSARRQARRASKGFGSRPTTGPEENLVDARNPGKPGRRESPGSLSCSAGSPAPRPAAAATTGDGAAGKAQRRRRGPRHMHKGGGRARRMFSTPCPQPKPPDSDQGQAPPHARCSRVQPSAPTRVFPHQAGCAVSSTRRVPCTPGQLLGPAGLPPAPRIPRGAVDAIRYRLGPRRLPQALHGLGPTPLHSLPTAPAPP